MQPGIQTFWDAVIALDEDLWQLRRYITFAPDNLGVYSLELQRLIQMAAVETEATLLWVCTNLVDPTQCHKGNRAKPFGELLTLLAHKVESELGVNLHNTQVRLRRFPDPLMPFQKGVDQKTFAWWDAFTSLKHQKPQNEAKANLKHALEAFSALASMVSLTALLEEKIHRGEIFCNLEPLPKVLASLEIPGHSACVKGSGGEIWDGLPSWHLELRRHTPVSPF
ncbi:hypothetical protein TJA_07630 [Thermus sp. LT1-2-5]|uniref:hypothetical protein n=1 Tax=Thermus sp. LT1-2-5 TaxID=3026935 RepID=UPI0030E9BF5D